MSWREETEATARHLARLLARDGHVTAADLDAALTGRRAVLDLARTIHLDLTGLGSGSAAPTLEGLVEHPLRALGQLIHRQPRPHPQLPLSVITARSSTDATGKLWKRVAVHASLAEHHWRAALPGSRPRGDHAWSALDHVAALAQAVNTLDRHLAASAQHAERPELAEQLRQAAGSGLGTAAAAARALAAAGPLPDVADLRQPPTRQLLTVRDVTEVAPALRNVADQLLAVRHVSPGHLQMVTGFTARAALHAAVLAEAAAPHRGREWAPELAAALHEHGTHLTAVSATPRRTETVNPSDPLPLAQATEVARWLTSHPATPVGATPGRDLATAREVALAAAGLTEVLDVVARRHLDGGLWVVPSEGAWSAAQPYDWKFSGPTVTVPPLVRGLTEGAEHAAELRETATAVGGPPAPAPTSAVAVAQQGMPSTRDLAAALSATAETSGRPSRPGIAAARPRTPAAMTHGAPVER